MLELLLAASGALETEEAEREGWPLAGELL